MSVKIARLDFLFINNLDIVQPSIYFLYYTVLLNSEAFTTTIILIFLAAPLNSKKTQRYSSDDLYKPRPLFSGSRRRTTRQNRVD